jgi:hypothetical protein
MMTRAQKIPNYALLIVGLPRNRVVMMWLSTVIFHATPPNVVACRIATRSSMQSQSEYFAAAKRVHQAGGG